MVPDEAPNADLGDTLIEMPTGGILNKNDADYNPTEKVADGRDEVILAPDQSSKPLVTDNSVVKESVNNDENDSMGNELEERLPTPDEKGNEESKIDNEAKKPELFDAKESIEIGKKLTGTHQMWHTLLQKYVSEEGKVNYQGFKLEGANLDNYLNELSNSVPSDNDKSLSAMAFWINAYNAFTIKIILDHYPVNSITEIANGKPWDKKWIMLGAKMLSLNDIEHVILRPTWNDARIHFAVNCAAKSCPPLSNKAFTGSNTEGLLDKLTSRFINNPKFNQISPTKLTLSKIFEWYKEDFGDLPKFVNEYTTSEIKSNAAIRYQEYDWSLNSI